MKEQTKMDMKDVLTVLIWITFILIVITASFYFFELKYQNEREEQVKWWEITENATITPTTTISSSDTLNSPFKDNLRLESNYGGLNEF